MHDASRFNHPFSSLLIYITSNPPFQIYINLKNETFFRKHIKFNQRNGMPVTINKQQETDT